MKTCLFTVSFAGFWGQHKLSLEEAIAKTAALGFQGIEIMGKRPHLSPLDYSLADLERYAKTFLEYMRNFNLKGIKS